MGGGFAGFGRKDLRGGWVMAEYPGGQGAPRRSSFGEVDMWVRVIVAGFAAGAVLGATAAPAYAWPIPLTPDRTIF
jgi:hypothetical protein